MARDAAQDEQVREHVEDVGRAQLAAHPDRQALRVNSSTTLSMRYFRPSWVRSSTKS
jgi:hypothetical protein